VRIVWSRTILFFWRSKWTIEINATNRKAQGTGASRRLRHAGRVPGVVYGVGEVNMIEMDHNELYHKLPPETFTLPC